MIANANHPDNARNQAGDRFFWGEAACLWLGLVYFAAKAIFFAVRIRERVFPDEIAWFGLAEVFSRSPFLPVDSGESAPFGLVRHIPSLYFFLMGKALVVKGPLPVSDLLFLRLINVGLAVLTVAMAWRLARSLGVGLAARSLFLVMLTNTMMFTFVAGAVNYDNLATLLAVVSLHSLLRFIREGGASRHGLLFVLASLAGTLTKNVLLPYTVGLALVFVLHLVRHPRSRLLVGQGARWWREGVLILCCLAGLVANLGLYGGNLWRFGVLIPSMDQVLPLELCLQNRLFARDYVVREFVAGRLPLLEAQRLALRIREPGDRALALSRLEEAEQDGVGAGSRLDRWHYTLEWGKIVVARTYSVAAHLSLFKHEGGFLPYYLIFVAAGLAWLFRFKALALPGLGVVAFVSLFYTVILMQVVNYATYRSSGLSGLALTGRYMFPVLAPLYLLIAHGLLAKMPRWWQATVGGGVAVWFVLGELPWFVRQAGAEWYW